MSAIMEVIHGLPSGAAGVFGVLTLVIALLQCFMGYKLLKLWVTLAGAAIGVIIGIIVGNVFIKNATATTVLALVLLTLLPWRVNASGVFYGGICGVIASLAISFGVNTLALHCYAVANLAVTLLFCLVLSGFFGSPALSRGFRP